MATTGAWLVIIAFVLATIGVFGAMNNYNNRYPIWFIGIAMALGLIANFGF